MNKFTLLITLTLLVSVCTNIAWADDLLDILFSEQPTADLRLSPSGALYIKTSVSKQASSLSVFNTRTLAENNVIDLAELFDENTVLRDIQWIDNQHVAAVLIDKEALENTLLERNSQTRLIIIDVTAAKSKPLVYEVTTQGSLIEAAPTQNGVFYFARNGRKSKVYKIQINKLLTINQKRNKLTRVDGGQFIAKNVVVQTDGFAIRWFFEPSGEPVAVAFFNEEQKLQLAVFEKTGDASALTLKPIKTWEKDELESEEERQKVDNKEERAPLFLPIAKSSKSNAFYATNYHEEQALSLYLVDYENDTFEQIYNSPGLPIKDIIFSKDNDAMGVVVIEEGLYTTEYFDGQPVKSDTNMLNVVADESVLGDVKLFYREAHNKGGQFLLQIEDNIPVLVHKQFPALSEQLPSSQIVGTVEVDNMPITYLLTLPQGASSNNPAPLIIMPHGGPFNVFDTPYFDPMTQFFAANNYAVLRVNFRGSGGYGLTHRDAGKKQWGTKMIDDLSAALINVQERADINATKTCSVGMSYGGYASLMLNLQSPALFKCAVSVAGVTDMNLFLKQPHITYAQKEWLREYVGDTQVDQEALFAISPLYQMQHFKTPLLLIHGAKDERVIAEHSFRVKLVLEQANIPLDWVLYEDANHHFAEEGQTKQLFASILDFVNEHLKPVE
ncbi:MAG: dipeptidyl aminopeptidase/acylaminoacyl peptidase [Alphaproteobacteria bacterium]|jgi:dipeptidyl aminopeptidase/acylaminoacyl peptidase